MNLKEIDSYLSNIEEFVFDEQIIVTYSWLSKTLKIHSNVSKQLLFMYFEKNQKKDELCVTYLLMGIPHSGNTHHVLIVKDKDLQDVESSLKSITSKHIYSVQKCQKLPSDLTILYTAERTASIDNVSKGISGIHFNCNERDGALIAKLKTNALPLAKPAVLSKKTESNKGKAAVQNAKSEEKTISSKEDSPKSKPEVNKSVIPSMFSNKTVPKTKNNEKASAAVGKKKAQGGIGAFFNKTLSKPINEPEKITKNNETKEEEKLLGHIEERLSPAKENKATLNICPESTKHSSLEGSPKETHKKVKKTEVKTKASSKKVDSKRSKKAKSKKDDSDQKKRKRLVVLSDSDSNDTSEDEVMREPTPEPEAAVKEDDMDDVVYGTPEPSRKRKKRKLVSRTFKDSEGYMVTEKEYIYVSCSDAEEEEAMPEKKLKESPSKAENNTVQNNKISSKPSDAKKESPKNKNTSPQKIKQSSLMSFFKKK